MPRKSLSILLKKNLIVHQRSYGKFIIEIITIIAIFITIIIQQLPTNESSKETSFHKDIILNDLSQFKKLMAIKSETIPYQLYFTPNNNYTQNVFKRTAEKLKLNGSEGFDTETEMVDNFRAANTLAGVVLNGHNVTLRFPNYFRTKTNNNNYYKSQDFWLTRCSGYLDADNNNNHLDFYEREGFLQLLYTIIRSQLEVENTAGREEYEMPELIFMHHSTEPKVGCVNDVSRKRTTSSDSFLNWSLYYFIYFVPFLNLVWIFSREQEDDIFAHHWIYGYTYNAQRSAHFIVSLIHLILLDLLVFGFIIYTSPALPADKSSLLFVFLLLYNMLLIVYAMILAAFISNSKTAVWCGATLWITSYAVFSELLNTTNFDILKPKIIIISLAFFNNILPNGLKDYLQRDENKTLQEIMELLAIEFLILLLLGCLLKCVDFYWPGRYIKRISRLLIKPLWKMKTNLFENNMEYGPLKAEVLELKNVSTLSLQHKNKPLLKNISMRFFKNEISVILGPHGSGKTTLISILAGWQTYEGEIIYQEHDITKKWSYYRNHIDVSMTNNALIDMLTIRETLKYFILIKQSQDNEILLESELNKWLNIFKPIVNDCQKLVKNLSFGEKRLLSLCCTLLCNTSLVLLDEPSRHMKAENQFRYWDILKNEKHNRAIIVTTCSIDEAAEIGDRIGILNVGNLTAWGSSYYLRTKFGVGFYLVCFIQPMKPIKPITQLLEQYISNIKIKHLFIDRVIYLIPADRKPIFQRLFIELEKNLSKFGITNIYMTGSSLNDVYMAMTMRQDQKHLIPDVKQNLKFLHEKKTKQIKCFNQAILYRRLMQQAKSSLSVVIIFLACFLILAFDHMSLASLKVHSITFSGAGVAKDSYSTYMEILNVNDITNGLFSYHNVAYGNDSYEHKLSRNSNSLAAIEFKKPQRSIWMNEDIFHSAPLALNLAFSSILNDSIYINKPINLQTVYDLHIILGTIMPLTMSITFVILQDERFSNMLALQRIAGLDDRTRWLMTFVWDYSVYLLVTTLYIIIIITSVLDNIRWGFVIAGFLLLFLCGIPCLLFVYLMSLFIAEDNKTRAFIKIFLIQFLLGLFPYILYNNILKDYFEFLFYIFMISPGFSVLHGTTKIFNNNERIDFASYFQWNYPGFLDSICYILLIAIIYFTVFVAVIVYRKNYLQSTPKKVKKMASVCYPYEDERVIKEKVRISNMNIKACRAQAILVDQLESKLPKTGNRVSAISFALNKYSCLGIYGCSHSGKSHLLKQLIGEQSYWFGEVYIAGFNCKTQLEKAMKHIGYCPQNKGFNSLLTPRELLNYFLMLNGVNYSKRLDRIRELSVSLHLRHYMNFRIGHLPENIQRRINVAVALVAHPEILVLDEPTKGLPAFDRHLIWNILKYYRSLGNTIIFTTTESLELKELSDVTIAVNDGEMLVFDSSHNMEHQYNVGFYLEIKLYKDGLTLEEVEENFDSDVENLNRFVMFFNEESELLYCSGSVVKYYVPVENVIYSYIFGSIEKNSQRLNISNYTLSPYSLNNVLRLLQKSRKEKRRHERSRRDHVLKDAKILPRRD